MNQENKNIFIIIFFTSVIISALFGASAGFLAVTNSQIRGYLQEILPGDIDIAQDSSGNFSEKQIINVEENSAVIDAVERVSPAVVSVIVTKDLPKLEQFYYNPFGNDDFFSQFFGNDFLVPGTRQHGTEKQEVGGGTGFIISADGFIVTNKHVVIDEEAQYTVLMNDEKKYEAEVLARDPASDMAVLKINAENLPTVTLGDSDSLKTGQSVIAIGNALGEFRNTVSTGVISGLARSITAGGSGFAEELTNIIQTDAAINPGNSGGPLLNIAGQVIGINTAVASGAQGIGFAIPINEVKNTIETVKKEGKIVRPWLGVRYLMLNEQIAKDNNLPINEGALVVRGDQRSDLAVIPGSPADKAGLVENDIIIELNGQKIDKNNNLTKILASYKPGDEITLKIWHKGEEKEAKVLLGEFSG